MPAMVRAYLPEPVRGAARGLLKGQAAKGESLQTDRCPVRHCALRHLVDTAEAADPSEVATVTRGRVQRAVANARSSAEDEMVMIK